MEYQRMEYQEHLVYVYAEYCPGPFYWGWWLYTVPLIDGLPPPRGGPARQYEWLRDIRFGRVCEALGLPVSYDMGGGHYSKVIDIFMQNYPNGAVLKQTWWGTYEADVPEGIETWKCLKKIRENQLLDWKEARERIR